MKLSEVTVAASFTQNSVYAVATTSCLVCAANYNNGAIFGDAGCFEGTGDVVDAAPESLGCFTLKHLTKKDGKVIDHYILREKYEDWETELSTELLVDSEFRFLYKSKLLIRVPCLCQR